MSDTPLCDAVGTNGGFYRSKEHGWYVPIEFARRLERNLKHEEMISKINFQLFLDTLEELKPTTEPESPHK